MAYDSFIRIETSIFFNKAAIGHLPLAIVRFFRFIDQLVTVLIWYPLRLVHLAIEIHHHGVTQRLYLARFGILQALLHLKAGIAHLRDAALAYNRVVEMHRLAEVQIHVDEDVFECKPVDWGLEDILEIAASTHVEVVALRPVVDVVVRIEVAQTDLDGTGEHNAWF